MENCHNGRLVRSFDRQLQLRSTYEIHIFLQIYVYLFNKVLCRVLGTMVREINDYVYDWNGFLLFWKGCVVQLLFVLDLNNIHTFCFGIQVKTSLI